MLVQSKKFEDLTDEEKGLVSFLFNSKLIFTFSAESRKTKEKGRRVSKATSFSTPCLLSGHFWMSFHQRVQATKSDI